MRRSLAVELLCPWPGAWLENDSLFFHSYPILLGSTLSINSAGRRFCLRKLGSLLGLAPIKPASMSPTSFEGIVKSLQPFVQLLALPFRVLRLASYPVYCVLVHLHDGF